MPTDPHAKTQLAGSSPGVIPSPSIPIATGSESGMRPSNAELRPSSPGRPSNAGKRFTQHPSSGAQAVPDADGALAPGETFGGRYRIERLVGRGGQGDVYRCVDGEVPGHVVAVKLLHQATRTDAERAFAMRELRMMAAVSHPAIVQFKDLGWYGARLFFVMPWLEGKTLEDAMPLDRREARRVFEIITGGVAALHSKGMRHQDLKPSNIFLSRVDGIDEAVPLLLDLGVAARDGDAPIAGSPDYFAPEIARAWPTGSSVGIGLEADIFALALTLRNALEPESAPVLDPFSMADLETRATQPVALPARPDLAYLGPAFARWLSVDPTVRPTASGFLAELAKLTEPEDRAKARADLWRRVAPWVLGLVVLLAAVAFGVQHELEARERESLMAETSRLRAEAEARGARQQAATAERARETAMERAEASEREANERAAQAASAMDRVSQVQREIERAQGDSTRLRQALESLRSALTEAEAARESERASLTSQIAETQRARAQVQATFDRERAALTGSLERAQASLTEAQAEIASAEASRREVAAQLEAARTQLAAQQATNTRLEAEVRSLEAQVRAAEGRRAAWARPETPTAPIETPTQVVGQPTYQAPVIVQPGVPGTDLPSVTLPGQPRTGRRRVRVGAEP